ncbi:hypothetical protein [Streptomyces sp. 7N604]|uniref:hypothetical protein n=1 Tax=Streptomyces sp. 7N604 TaxID=3457415 RepID=UPI003FD41E6D
MQRGTAGLLVVFALLGASACAGGAETARLEKAAASDEVQAKRAETERELRAEAARFQRDISWIKPARLTVEDRCSRGHSQIIPDNGAPVQSAMSCRMRVHLYFAPGRPVPEVIRKLASTDTPVKWTKGSVETALRYQEEKRYAKPHAYPPSLSSAHDGSLSWDVPNEELQLPEPCSKAGDIYHRCEAEPDGVTLPELRKQHGTLFVWQDTISYHEIPRT